MNSQETPDSFNHAKRFEGTFRSRLRVNINLTKMKHAKTQKKAKEIWYRQGYIETGHLGLHANERHADLEGLLAPPCEGRHEFD